MKKLALLLILFCTGAAFAQNECGSQSWSVFPVGGQARDTSGVVHQALCTDANGIFPPNGGFLAPTGLETSGISDTNTAAPASNVVRVQQFTLPYPVIVGHLNFTINTLSAGGHCDICIYSKSGNTLILHTGSQLTSATGDFSVAFTTPSFLPAGVYKLAWVTDNTVAIFNGVGTGQTHQNLLRLNDGSRSGTAANAGTAGVCPATLGAITSAALNSIVVFLEP